MPQTWGKGTKLTQRLNNIEMKKLIIQIVLAGVIVFLGYQCYQSIMIPQRFQNIKDQRYLRIINRLKDIRTAQEAYKDVYGQYTGSFDTLIHFIKFDSIKVVRSIGSLSDEDLENGVTEAQAIKEGKIIRDTIKAGALETLKTQDSVFCKDYAIEDIRYVPFTKHKHQFKMGATKIWTDSGVEVPIFEAYVTNMVIFEDIRDEYNDELLQENGERKRLKKFAGLKVGDLKEANNNVGNWE